MHKVYFEIRYIDQWYQIIAELKKWFGNEWKGQRGIRKKFHKTFNFDFACFFDVEFRRTNCLVHSS